jgi:hypothetical protein
MRERKAVADGRVDADALEGFRRPSKARSMRSARLVVFEQGRSQAEVGLAGVALEGRRRRREGVVD